MVLNCLPGKHYNIIITIAVVLFSNFVKPFISRTTVYCACLIIILFFFPLAFLNLATLQLFFDLYRALPTSLSPMVSSYTLTEQHRSYKLLSLGRVKGRCQPNKSPLIYIFFFLFNLQMPRITSFNNFNFFVAKVMEPSGFYWLSLPLCLLI